jgi:hypothetical protein
MLVMTPACMFSPSWVVFFMYSSCSVVETESRWEWLYLDAVSGMGGTSFPLSFLLREKKDLPPLDCRGGLSLWNMV